MLAVAETSKWLNDFSELMSDTIFHTVEGSFKYTMMDGYEKDIYFGNINFSIDSILNM